MKTVKTGLVLLAAVLLCANGAHAGEFFISPTGNDAGAGTQADPWQSPSRGASARVNGAHGAAAMTLSLRTTEGFLPSGSINIAGVGNVSYNSITGGTTFNLDAALGSNVNDSTIVHDGDILGGNGYDPGDIITLRGGTYTNQTLRLRNSGVDGNPITYRAFAGETPVLDHNDGGLHKGVIWHDGENAISVANLDFDGLSIVTSGTSNEHGTSLGAAAGLKFRNMNINTHKSHAFLFNKGSGGSIENSIIRAAKGEAIRTNSGARAVTVSHSVIWDSFIGMGTNGSGSGEITGTNLTIVGGPTQHLWMATSQGGASNNVELYDSILLDHEPNSGAATRAVLHGGTGLGDYNLFWDIGNDSYYNAFVGGANDMLETVDPGFLEIDDMSDADWLRFDVSSPAATASSTGSYVGAFAPVPEPATLLVLGLAGALAFSSRRR